MFSCAEIFQSTSADAGYRMDVVLKKTIEISASKGFSKVVERTFAWLSNFRRMSKDYEHFPITSQNNTFFNILCFIN